MACSESCRILTNSNCACTIVINDRGRSLIALQNIKEGQSILSEKPLVSAQFLWNRDYCYKACQQCMRPLEAVAETVKRLSANAITEIPRPDCCATNKTQHVCCEHCGDAYCCVECRQTAWIEHHNLLCHSKTDEHHPLVQLEYIWKNTHYPPETATILLVTRMFARLISHSTLPDDGSNLSNMMSVFCKATVEEELTNIGENTVVVQQIHKLLGDKFKDHIDHIRNVLCTFFCQDELSRWLTKDGFTCLLALIGRNSQGVGTSSIAAWAKNCKSLELEDSERNELECMINKVYDAVEAESSPFLDNEGVGLYLKQSACNHSCRPNAEVQFEENDHTLSLVALEEISCEEEIFISYLSECDQSRSRHSRQKILKENYLFTCDCIQCLEEADQPDVSSDDEWETDEEMDEH